MASLPSDIYFSIFSFLDAASLARCLRVDSQLNDAASASQLWEPHYRTRYHHSSSHNEAHRIESCQRHYRLMYAYRRRLDRAADSLLERIVTDRRGRLSHAQELVAMEWDVFDFLSSINPPSSFTGDNADNQSYNATRHFWAKNVVDVITRRYAVQSVWSRLLPGNTTEEEGTDHHLVENALSSLSCFFGKSPFLISNYFDQLGERCREYIEGEKVALLPNHASYDLQRICVHICDFMHKEGYGPPEDAFLSDVIRLFPHSYTTNRKRTIPICLVHVFAAVARRVGVAASPISFPSRVLARVTVGKEDVDDFFVDVYGSQHKAILSLHVDIPQLLSASGVSPATFSAYISPASAFTMLNRAAQNIINTQRVESDGPDMSVDHPADYAALSVLILSGEAINSQLIHYMMSCINVPALDSVAFLKPVFAPLLRPITKGFLMTACEASLLEENETTSCVKKRTGGVLHKVGAFMQHRKYGYKGLIYGWDVHCHASGDWQQHMGVSTLARGADQPFYNVITSDDGSLRYVAEDNVELIHVDSSLVHRLYLKYPLLARWFSNVEADEKNDTFARMELSDEAKQMYPEDSP